MCNYVWVGEDLIRLLVSLKPFIIESETIINKLMKPWVRILTQNWQMVDFRCVVRGVFSQNVGDVFLYG